MSDLGHRQKKVLGGREGGQVPKLNMHKKMVAVDGEAQPSS